MYIAPYFFENIVKEVLMHWRWFLVLGLFILVGSNLRAVDQQYIGYLSDTQCGQRGQDSSGNDLALSPQKHTMNCIRKLAHTGLGIIVKDKDGSTYYYRFDAKGNTLIQKTILKQITSKTTVKLKVTGKLNQDGLLNVNKITVLSKQIKKKLVNVKNN